MVVKLCRYTRKLTNFGSALNASMFIGRVQNFLKPVRCLSLCVAPTAAASRKKIELKQIFYNHLNILHAVFLSTLLLPTVTRTHTKTIVILLMMMGLRTNEGSFFILDEGKAL